MRWRGFEVLGFSMLVGSPLYAEEGQRAVAAFPPVPSVAAPAPTPAALPVPVATQQQGHAYPVLPRPPAPLQEAPLTVAAPEKERRIEQRWYGDVTLAVDGAALGGILLGALALSDDARAPGALLLLGGSTVYLTGAPVVHFAHGRVGAGFGSIGLRLGAPFLGAAAAVGLAGPGEGCDFCGIREAVTGFAVGVIVAPILDAALLAYETVAEEPPVMLAPAVHVSRNVQSIGVRGVF